MINKIYLSFLFFSMILFSFFCRPRYQDRITPPPASEITDIFIDANKAMIQDEERMIDSLLLLSNTYFRKDSTGIRIHIDHQSDHQNSNYPIDGDNISIAYNCVVFDDTQTVIDNVFIDTLTFKIGYSKQMRGLNYAIKLLKIGDKAKIIIPSYLGFGLSGYKQSVPPYSTLLLNIKLLNIEK